MTHPYKLEQLRRKIGSNIQYFRESKDLSREDLAKKFSFKSIEDYSFGISAETIKNLEEGRIRIVDIEMLYILSEVLGVNFISLINLDCHTSPRRSGRFVLNDTSD